MTEQLDLTITINTDHHTPKELATLKDEAAQSAAELASGELVNAKAERVPEAITRHAWTNDLVRELAWMTADRHDGDENEDERDQIIQWMNDNEDDENIWHEISKLIDAITYRAQNL